MSIYKKKFTGSKLIFKVTSFPSNLSLGKIFIGNFFQLTHQVNMNKNISKR